MNLSIAFHCIPHDVLVAKRHAYGLLEDTVIFLYLHLKRRKQGVKINDTESFFRNTFIGYTTRFHIRSHFIKYLDK